tara:strand:- start:291 stop:497 length:207 start_codon:yes stop_codon:yes gene_type:complete
MYGSVFIFPAAHPYQKGSVFIFPAAHPYQKNLHLSKDTFIEQTPFFIICHQNTTHSSNGPMYLMELEY